MTYRVVSKRSKACTSQKTYSDGNRLPHVTNSEATEWWVLSEGLDAHGLGRNHLDDGSITRSGEAVSVRQEHELVFAYLTNFGFDSMDLPVRRSIFSRSSENLQAMWAVWQSRTGA